MSNKVLFSGIQPTGNLMIGNYIGAIKNWKDLMDKYHCYFVLVDLHAITVKQDPRELLNRCYEFIALYIACGLDPDKCTLFVQSHVKAHAQLSWILNCYTYPGELNRMTQFKDKSTRHEKNINVGLYNYPVLMASDILLYGTDLVPVGADQKQHLELARNLAERFNNIYGETFTVPEPYIPPRGARVMSLQDPTAKMSKSDNNVNSYIALLDSPEKIEKKFKKAVTDLGTEVKYDETNKPGISNLMIIMSTVTGKSVEGIEKEFVGQGYGAFKKSLAEATIEFLKPIQEKYQQLSQDKIYLHEVIKKGAELAEVEAEKMLKKVYEKIGFIKMK